VSTTKDEARVHRRLVLNVLPDTFAICRLEPALPLPSWSQERVGPVFISRTDRELSLILPESRVPADVQAERGYRGLRVAGTLDFDATGIMASLAEPMADAAIPIMAVSTHDTDYIFVRAAVFDRAQAILRSHGHTMEPL
jgi:hypothetical protein